MNKEKIHNRNPKILFVNTLLDMTGSSYISFSYHLGVSYILAYLKEKGIHGDQFIFNANISPDRIADNILKLKPEIVGFVCYDANYYFVKILSGILKRLRPDLTIIAGGPTATFSDKLVLDENPAIDLCVRGEGEYTVYELINAFEKGNDVASIQGITYREKNKIIANTDRDLMTGDDLDTIPSPYLSGIIPPEQNVGIVTSRGCVHKCTYCNFSAMSRWKIRYNSVERVISEIKTICDGMNKHGLKSSRRYIEIYDDNFTINKNRAKEICRHIINLKMNVKFNAMGRADTIDKELLELMAKAKFDRICFGLESASPKVLSLAGKVGEPVLTAENLENAKKYLKSLEDNVAYGKKLGLTIFVSVIRGLPGAEKEDDLKTIKFINKINPKVCFFNSLNVFAGTKLFETYKDWGINVRKSLISLPYFTELAYDVSSLEEPDNSYHKIFVDAPHAQRFFDSVSGRTEASYEQNLSGIYFERYKIKNSDVEWLRSILPIAPIICFLSDHQGKSELKSNKENMNKLLSSHLPVSMQYRFLRYDAKSSRNNRNVFSPGKYQLGTSVYCNYPRTQNIKVMSFSSNKVPIEKNRSNCGQKHSSKVIFLIESSEDIDHLKEISIKGKDVVIKEGVMIKNDCCFLDECRWSGKKCPACKMARMIISRDGSLKPCFNGGTVGQIGDPFRSIRMNISLMQKKEEERRGCKTCEIRKSCSKCLFPHPFTAREYCNLRKRMAKDKVDISALSRLFKFLSTLRTYKELSIGASAEKIIFLRENRCVLLKNKNGKNVVYDYEQ